MVLCENGISYMSQSYQPTYSRKGNFFFYLSYTFFGVAGYGCEKSQRGGKVSHEGTRIH